MTKKSNPRSKRFIVELINDLRTADISVENMIKYSIGIKEHSDNTVKGLADAIKISTKLNTGEMALKEYKSSSNFKNKRPKEIDKPERLVDKSKKAVSEADVNKNLKKTRKIDKDKEKEKLVEKEEISEDSEYTTQSEISDFSDIDQREIKNKLESSKYTNKKDKAKVISATSRLKKLVPPSKLNATSEKTNRIIEPSTSKLLGKQIKQKEYIKEDKDRQCKDSQFPSANKTSEENEESDSQDNDIQMAELVKKQKKLRLSTLIESLIFIKVNAPASTGIKTIHSKLVEIKDLIDFLYQEPGLYQVSLYFILLDS